MKPVKCSFCDSEKVKDEDLPFCSTCWTSLEENTFPKLEFKEFFSEGLERKLKQIDSLLFTIPENFLLWYLKGHLEHELGSTKKALNSIKTSISYKGDYGDPWIRLGLIYSDMHKESEAIDHFRKGLQFNLLDPSNLIDAGISLQASDQPKLASKILQRVLDLVPDDDRALVALGKVFVQIGDLEQAKSTLQKGIELYPHNEEVLRGMAQILLRLDDLDSAMEMYSRILDQHPRDFEALLAKGEIHLKRRELAHSIKAYQAVKDLDINISWAGILKFIISTLRSMMDSNENTLSYREDLKQEYENIMLFLKELEGRVGGTQGPQALAEIESLIKVIENQRLTLKDQVRQFEGLLEKYKVEDSFHQHLQMKVKNLNTYLEDSRYFDGKQIALELSPFLTDLRSMETGMEGKVKERLHEKLEELREIGMENRDLLIRLQMVEDLEKEGNLEGATFMLKEVEVSLEEYWIDASKRYHEMKTEELKNLLEMARSRFDTSGLTEIFRTFKNSYEKGPRSVTEGYEEFMKRYKEDSASFYKKETERVLKEIDLNLQLIEKDGAKVNDLRTEYLELMDDVEEEKDQQALFVKVGALLQKIGYFEEQQKISKIRFRLRNLDTLLGEVDFLGMDEELARNVEPVRRVIERSLKQENHRLSEILTNELYDNVEKILSENYRKELGELIQTTEGEIIRLRGLGVEKKDWGVSLGRSKKIMSGEETGPMTEVINHLARIQTDIQEFIVGTLPKEIDNKLEVCQQRLKEGLEYGFTLSGEERQLHNLSRSASEISSMDILEEAYKFDKELDMKITALLTKATKELEGRIRAGIEGLTEMGIDRQSVIDILSMVNRSEVLVDSMKHREAWELMTGAQTLLADLKEAAYLEIKEKRMTEIKSLFAIAQQLEVDTKEIAAEHKAFSKKKKDSDPEADMKLVVSIYDRLVVAIKVGANDRFEAYKMGYEEILKSAGRLLPENMPPEMRMQLKEVRSTLKNGSMEDLPKLLEDTGKLLDEAIVISREKALLEKASGILEEGLSLNDPRAKDIVKTAQDLAKRIKSGKKDVAEEELDSLDKEVKSLRSLIQMQNIETTLEEVQELDELARDVFDAIEDERFSERITKMTKTLSQFLDRTTALYKDPDPKIVNELSNNMALLNNEIVELEQEWRARKRLDILEEMGLGQGKVEDTLLASDITNLSKQFDKKDWNRFFRTWERVEVQIKKMEKKGTLPGGSTKLIEEAPATPGFDILSRKKKIKKKTGAPIKMPRSESGISRLAKEMEEKKKRIEEKPEIEELEELVEVKQATPEENQAVPDLETGEKEKKTPLPELTDIARSIAGERIGKLMESDSKAIGGDVPIPEDDEVDEMMEDILEIDTSVRKKDETIEAVKVREKLKLFFDRFPMMSQLDEARSRFENGEKLLKKGKKSDAIKEYRVAMSIAIKIGKVHMDMRKALQTVRATLDKLKSKGFESGAAEDLYDEGSLLLNEGDLLGCARTIKSIREELSRME